MFHLSVRIDFEESVRLGPGKVALLEKIGETGSISAAGRAMKMSYRRAWILVEELNAIFQEPLVQSQSGGKNGGGAVLTAFGKLVVKCYCQVVRDAERASKSQIKVLQKHVRTVVRSKLPH